MSHEPVKPDDNALAQSPLFAPGEEVGKRPAEPQKPLPKVRLLDSPWYWAYLFCTAALIMLVVMKPKFAQRQTLDERNFQGRQRANQQALGEAPSVPLSTTDDRIITLTPLFLLIGAAFLVCWGFVWWQLMGRRWWGKRNAGKEVSP